MSINIKRAPDIRLRVWCQAEQRGALARELRAVMKKYDAKFGLYVLVLPEGKPSPLSHGFAVTAPPEGEPSPLSHGFAVTAPPEGEPRTEDDDEV